MAVQPGDAATRCLAGPARRPGRRQSERRVKLRPSAQPRTADIRNDPRRCHNRVSVGRVAYAAEVVKKLSGRAARRGEADRAGRAGLFVYAGQGEMLNKIDE